MVFDPVCRRAATFAVSFTKSNTGKIRFGSILTEDEKNWLCWEIREFIQLYAPSLA